MNKIIVFIAAISIMSVAACNNSDKSRKETEMSKTDSSQSIKTDTTKPMEVNHSFTDVDSKLASSLKTVVDHYLHIKNALVNDNGSDAADGGKAMADAMD